MRKFLSLFLSLIMLSVFLTSCSKNETLGVLKINGKDVEVSSVLKINNEKVPFDLFRYFFLSIKDSMIEENNSVDLTKGEGYKTLMDRTVKEVKYIYAIRDIADKYGYKLSDKDYAEIDETMKSAYDYSENAKKYKELLEENYLTHDVYKTILETNYLSNYIADSLIGTDETLNEITFDFEDALKSYVETHYRLVDMYFSYSTKDENNLDLKEDEIEKNRKKAEADAKGAYAKLSSRSFEDVMGDYFNKEQIETALNTYYPISSFNNMKEVDLKSLKVNETTEVVHYSNVYTIIKRLETDEKWLRENNKSEVEAAYVEVLLDKLIEETIDGYKTEKLQYFDKITVESLV